MRGPAALRGALLALGVLALSPAGAAARAPHEGFAVGAASVSFTPPAAGPRDAAIACPRAALFTGRRRFAFEEAYTDLKHTGHFDAGDPYRDCNGNGRWDGNFLGGGGDSPRLYTHVLDPVGARALVVRHGGRRLAVEVVDQEGLFNVYADAIRARVAADGVRLDGIYISATHDESAPDSLGISGVSAFTSSVNAYFTSYLVQRSALAIEQAARRVRPARLRFAQAVEPANLRQCWSSYPYVDDRRMPILQAVGRDGRAIATLANVSQHAETLGFNPDPSERVAISSDWIHFLRADLERRYGGVGIEMAGSVGSVETPEVFPKPISQRPQRFVDESHPAGCRTLFGTRQTRAPLGYAHEDVALARAIAGAVGGALRHARPTRSFVLWGRSAAVCVPLTNQLFQIGASIGVFAARPGYTEGCAVKTPVLPNGSTTGTNLLTRVSAFRIGDGQFVTVPGEVFPFTFLRGALGPEDLPHPADPLPVWLLPHMHAPFRFVDGLGEDMLGYIFPPGNGVGVTGEPQANSDGSDRDRFGCGHSDDGEAASSETSVIVGAALARLLDAGGIRPERVVRGRYVLPGGVRSRSPLGDPGSIKCTVDTVFRYRGQARGVAVGGRVVHPHAWMDLHGRPQRRPDRDTRGYFDGHGRRVWVDVFAG